MKILLISTVLAGSLCTPFLMPESQVQDPQDPQDAMAKMMAKARRYTQPGKHHKVLERFIGKWDTEIRLYMGGKSTPPEKGSAEYSWLMEGRWLQMKSSGKMMSQPTQMFWIMGYDNFKKSYVCSGVNSIDTAMVRSEGDMDPDGKTLLLYGTVDEYLTGEHDKMVKTVFRFQSEDKILMEVHDLPIGEHNTKVFDILFTRKN